MMYKLLLIAVPLLWVGGTLFLIGYYAYHHQFDLMYLTLLTSYELPYLRRLSQ